MPSAFSENESWIKRALIWATNTILRNEKKKKKEPNPSIEENLKLSENFGVD